jgi:6-phosphofructokinase 1
VLNKLQLDALVVLGDRATLDYAACLSKAGIPVIGIPKTVHNDVNGSDYCLGFSTALSRGVHFIQEIRAMAGSREEVAVVEILGRSTGLTTLIISLLASADRTLIPEVAFDPEALAMLLMDDKRANPASYAILVMSEASSIVPEKAQKYLPELSRLARSRTLAEAMTAQDRVEAEGQIVQDVKGRREIGSHVLGSGAVVTEILENLTGQRFLLQPLSYLLRTGEPDGQDLLGAMNFATLATKLLASGQTGRLIAYRQGANYVDVPLDVVSQSATHINVTDHYDAKLYTPKSSILWAARV